MDKNSMPLALKVKIATQLLMHKITTDSPHVYIY